MGSQDIVDNNAPKPTRKSNKVQETYNSLKVPIFKENLLFYIKNLLVKYKENIDKNNKNLDLTFKREFIKDFQDAMQNFIENFGSNIDLDDMIISIFGKNNDANEKVIEELKVILLDILKDIKLEERIKQIGEETLTKYDRKLNSGSSSKNKNITIKEINSIIDNVFQNDKNIKNFKQNYIQRQDKLFKKIDDKFQNNVFNKLLPKTRDRNGKLRLTNATKVNLGAEPSLFKRERRDTKTYKTISDFVDKIIFIINGQICKNVFKALGRFLTGIFALPFKIVKRITSLAKSLVGGTLSFAFNFILIPTLKAISFSLKTVFKIGKGIVKTITNIIKKSNIKLIILTPMGMYIVGFVAGLLWKRLQIFLGKHEFSWDNVFDWIKNLYEDIKGRIIKFVDKKLGLKELEELYDNFKINIENDSGVFETVGKLWEDIKDLKVISDISKFYKLLKRSWLFRFLSFCTEGILWTSFKFVEGLVTLFIEHPLLTSGILTALIHVGKFIINFPKYKRMGSMFATGISKIGGFFTGLIGSGIAMFGTIIGKAVTDAIFNNRDGLTSIQFVDKLNDELTESINQSFGISDFNLNDEDKDKFEYVKNMVINEANDNKGLSRELDNIREYYKKEGNDGSGKVDLYEEFPGVIDAIYNSDFYTEDEKRKYLTSFKEWSKKKPSLGDQIKTLSQILSVRSQRAKVFIDNLNTKNQDTLSSVLSEMVSYKKDDDKEPEIKLNINGDIFNKLLSDTIGSRQDYNEWELYDISATTNGAYIGATKTSLSIHEAFEKRQKTLLAYARGTTHPKKEILSNIRDKKRRDIIVQQMMRKAKSEDLKTLMKMLNEGKIEEADKKAQEIYKEIKKEDEEYRKQFTEKIEEKIKETEDQIVNIKKQNEEELNTPIVIMGKRKLLSEFIYEKRDEYKKIREDMENLYLGD